MLLRVDDDDEMSLLGLVHVATHEEPLVHWHQLRQAGGDAAMAIDPTHSLGEPCAVSKVNVGLPVRLRLSA